MIKFTLNTIPLEQSTELNSFLVYQRSKTDLLHVQNQDLINVIRKEALKPAYQQHLHSWGSETEFHLTIGYDIKHVPSLFSSQVMHVFMRDTPRHSFIKFLS